MSRVTGPGLPVAPSPPVHAAASYREWAGRSHGWRYLAQRTTGQGPAGVFLDNELPLSDVTITDVNSGPDQLTAVITPVALRELARPQTTENPLLLLERGTLIHAEYEGEIHSSYVLMGAGMEGPNLSLDCSGLTTVAKGMEYPGSVEFIEADPLDIIRHIWTKIQADPDSNIALQVDLTTKTPARVGKPLPVETTTGTTSDSGTSGAASTSADEKPYALNWWTTHDLGGEIDKLCEEHGIEYRIRSTWNADRTQVLHYLEFGYPALGTRRTKPRFVVGENINTMPTISRDGDEFANHVVVLGAGEGSEMIRGEARRRDGRIRTMVILDDKSITDKTKAARVAQLELGRRQQLTKIATVAVRNGMLAEFGSYQVGDEIRVQGLTDWSPFEIWARITSITIRPDDPDLTVVSLMRSDWYV